MTIAEEAQPRTRASDNGAGWCARPVPAWTLRVLALAIPAVVAASSTWVLAAWWPRPQGATQLMWWVGMLLAGTATFVAIERGARRLLPLAALLELSLAFPDHTPSRYRLALRAGTTRSLREVVERASRGDIGSTPAEAAETVLLLAAALNRHDRMTRGHSERVRAYAEILGAEMGMDEAALGRLRWSALLHDVGKLGVPAHVLNKPSRLTDAEFDTIKQHPLEGERMIAPLADWLGDEGTAVAQHHERFDGGGYPRGLRGHEISLAARVVAVADTFDVITSARSYKRPMTAAAARAEIARCSGTQFDPAVVKALLAISVGRLWRAGGPLTWAISLPGLAKAPMISGSLGSLGGAASAMGVAAVVAVASTTIAAAAEGPIRPIGEESAAVLGSTAHADDSARANTGPAGDPEHGEGRERSSADADHGNAEPGVGGASTPTRPEINEPAEGDTRSPAGAQSGASPSAPRVHTPTEPSGGALAGVIGGVSDTADELLDVVPPIGVPTVTVPPIQAPTVTVPVPGAPPISAPPVTVAPITLPLVTIPSVDELLGG